MYVYALRDQIGNRILSRKAKGGSFYTREGDAKNKIGNDHFVEVVKFELVEVPHNSEIKGNIYLYKRCGKLLSRKHRLWEPDGYVTFQLVEVPK